MSSIAELIINSRKSKNLTQEQLAELSKVNLRTIQRIENNKNTPRGYTLKLICDILEIDIPNSESKILPSKPNQIELIAEISALFSAAVPIYPFIPNDSANFFLEALSVALPLLFNKSITLTPV